tara:strand:- start:296 stop:799 length:504 start_codon:yes stop_codon:yes gene_type:complete
MKVLVLSDTHGFVDPSIVELARKADLVVHAGDIGRAEVLDCLTPRHGRVLAVAGNNDTEATWPTSDHATLADLPASIKLDLPGGVLAVEHGHRIWDTANYHARLRLKYPEARAIAYGHTHVRKMDTARRPWVLNPGVAGRVRTKGGSSCLLLSIKPDRWRVRAYVCA